MSSSAATFTAAMGTRYCNNTLSLRPSSLLYQQRQRQLYVKSVRRRSATYAATFKHPPTTIVHKRDVGHFHRHSCSTNNNSSTISWRFLSISTTTNNSKNNSKQAESIQPSTTTLQQRAPPAIANSATTSSKSLRTTILFQYTTTINSKQQHQQQIREEQRCTFSSTRDSTSDKTTSTSAGASSTSSDSGDANNNNNNNNNTNTHMNFASDDDDDNDANNNNKTPRKKKQQPRVYRKRDVNNPEYLRQRQERMDIVLISFRNNTIISVIKLMAWLHSGSSSMLAELIHSLVDSFNQGLLLIGHYYSGSVADRQHPYGYGKSVYFWSLVSALGTFFGGAGLSLMHSYHELMHPSLQTITWHVWGVLGISFLLDGQVLVKASKKFLKDKKKGDSVWSHLQKTRDPFNLAMLLEDGAACTGVLIAIAGISLSHTYQNPIYDGLGGVGISCLLGAVGITLAGFNHRFLLGQAVDAEIVKGIHDIIMKQRSIDGIRSVQTQWIGPDSFSYKAEVDFDGTYIAAKLLPSYLSEFSKAKLEIEHELRVLLSFYTEDVLRMVEQEVRSIEAEIRLAYPGAEYIELEPMSKDLDELYLDESKTAELKNIELEALRSHEESLQSADDLLFQDAEEITSSTTTTTTTATAATSTWDDTKKP